MTQEKPRQHVWHLASCNDETVVEMVVAKFLQVMGDPHRFTTVDS